MGKEEGKVCVSGPWELRLPLEEEGNGGASITIYEDGFVRISFMDFSAALGYKAVCKPKRPERFSF